MFKIQLQYLPLDKIDLPEDKICEDFLFDLINGSPFVEAIYNRCGEHNYYTLDIEGLKIEVQSEIYRNYLDKINKLSAIEANALIDWLTNQIWEYLITDAIDYYCGEGHSIWLDDAPLKQVKEV